MSDLPDPEGPLKPRHSFCSMAKVNGPMPLYTRLFTSSWNTGRSFFYGQTSEISHPKRHQFQDGHSYLVVIKYVQHRKDTNGYKNSSKECRYSGYDDAITKILKRMTSPFYEKQSIDRYSNLDLRSSTRLDKILLLFIPVHPGVSCHPVIIAWS